MTFTVAELEPPKGSIKNGKWTMTRSIWLKKASELDDYVADLLGTSFAAGSGVVQGAAQTFPGKPWLILDDVGYEPHGDEASGGIDYFGNAIDDLDDFGVMQPRNGYKFTLSYSTPTFDQGTLADPGNQDLPPLPTDTFLTVKVDLGMDILATDKSGFEWDRPGSGGVATLGVRTEVAAFVPTETLTLTWHRVPFPPWTYIRQLRGMLNNDTFLGHQAQSVMYLGLSGQREFQVNGTRQWQIDYRFGIKEVPYTDPSDGLTYYAGWNEFRRKDPAANDPEWQQIISKQNGYPLYNTANLNLLFTSETP